MKKFNLPEFAFLDYKKRFCCFVIFAFFVAEKNFFDHKH